MNTSTIFILTVLAVASACTLPAEPAPPPEDVRPSGPCADATYFEGEPQPATMLGDYVDGEFRFYAETGRAEEVWGYQGGVMIRPHIEVPPDLVESAECVQIFLENLPDAESPIMVESGALRRRLQLDESGRTHELDDLISWDTPYGLRFELRATVRGPDYALVETVTLEFDELDER